MFLNLLLSGRDLRKCVVSLNICGLLLNIFLVKSCHGCKGSSTFQIHSTIYGDKSFGFLTGLQELQLGRESLRRPLSVRPTL